MKTKMVSIFLLMGSLLTTRMHAGVFEKIKKWDGLLICGGSFTIGILAGISIMYQYSLKEKQGKNSEIKRLADENSRLLNIINTAGFTFDKGILSFTFEGNTKPVEEIKKFLNRFNNRLLDLEQEAVFETAKGCVTFESNQMLK